ncbi:MAG: hypothetical protein ACE5FN_11875 [Leptospirillia bacterium]
MTSNEGGFVLVLTLLTISLLSTMGLAALYQSNSEMAVVGNDRTGNELLMAADSGVEFGKNVVWAGSGFGTNSTVSFTGLDAYFSAQTLPVTLGPMNLSGNTFYSATIPSTVTIPGSTTPVSGYDQSDASKRIVTFQSRAWHDDNGNGAFDTGEPSRVVSARVAFEYGSLSFPFGVLTQNTECIFCHAKIIGDVVSLTSMTAKSSAFSIVDGNVYTMGTTNLGDPGVRVVAAYTDQDGNYATVEDAGETALNITTNYSDPERFPVDANGNPSFPKIENLDYYKGLAATYKGGAGSSISGATITGVPNGSTYASGKATLTSVDQSYAGNLILEGTPGNCIRLNGPIVVEGDLVIKGCVEGEGSLYAGGTVYIPASVTYSNPSSDRLAFAAGGNIVVGDYREGPATGGGKFVEKQVKQFNEDMKTALPAGERRYYESADGNVYDKKGNVITPAAGDTVVQYTPTDNAAGGNPWITTSEYSTDFLDTVTGVNQLDALAYTANGIFGINKAGSKKMTINGALVSADIGLLIPGANGKSDNYDPDNIGLTLIYDSRIENFLSIARNPTKTLVSWKEGIGS